MTRIERIKADFKTFIVEALAKVQKTVIPAGFWPESSL